MSLRELLQTQTGASPDTIERILRNAPRRYKVYQIPKRSGNGTRTIAHPARELKILQRIFLSDVLNEVPISSIAMAYVSGRGILKNAQLHQKSRWILKLDFKGFFHSITPRDWDRAVTRTESLHRWREDKILLHRLLFWGRGTSVPDCLSIGAPTSPAVSNLVCVKLDQWLAEEADRRGVIVSRYADDITISGSNVPELKKFEKLIASRLERNRGIQFQLNDAKRGLYGPGERRMVTGLILTPQGDISIGRERKRTINSLVNSFRYGHLDVSEKLRTQGLIAFAKDVELEFFKSLEKKYGKAVIGEIVSFTPDD